MNAVSTPHEWTKYIKFFSEQNLGRLTRLGIFERNADVVTDYWLESGLPLTGIDIDAHEDQPSIQITVGNFTHEVKHADKLAFKFSDSGDEDGIDISGADGRMTVLRFEDSHAVR
ncbi:hypothetical protein BH10ACI3_BH10ACI3_10220 [soil metagenome]